MGKKGVVNIEVNIENHILKEIEDIKTQKQAKALKKAHGIELLLSRLTGLECKDRTPIRWKKIEIRKINIARRHMDAAAKNIATGASKVIINNHLDAAKAELIGIEQLELRVG